MVDRQFVPSELLLLLGELLLGFDRSMTMGSGFCDEFTEDEIFGAPVLDEGELGEDEGEGDSGVGGCHPFALDWEFDHEVEVFETIANLNSALGMEVHSEAVQLQNMQRAETSPEVVGSGVVRVYVRRRQARNDGGLEAVVEECSRRPRQAQRAASSSNASTGIVGFLPSSPPKRRRSKGRSQPSNSGAQPRKASLARNFELTPGKLPGGNSGRTNFLQYVPTMLRHPFRGSSPLLMYSGPRAPVPSLFRPFAAPNVNFTGPVQASAPNMDSTAITATNLAPIDPVQVSARIA